MTTAIRSKMIAAARILLCAATLFIIYEATIKKPIDVPAANGDKVLHILAFSTLAFLSDFAFPSWGFGFRKLVPLMAFGILIELIQSFLPWRSADIMDFLADCVGIVAYGILTPILRRLPLISDRWNG